MKKKDIRSKHLLTKNFYQKKFLELYQSEMGSFFDMLTDRAQRAELNDGEVFLKKEVLPRLKNFLQATQKNWDDSNLIFTNYFKSIPELYSAFSIGKGLDFVFQENSDNDPFVNFWKENRMDSVLKYTFEKSMATGYDGGYFREENGKLKFQRIGFENYYPVEVGVFGYSENEINLVWIVSEKESVVSTYAYVINFKKENGVTITHKVFNYSSAVGFGEERKDLLKKIDTAGVLSEDGTEQNKYQEIPIVILSTTRKDCKGFGESIFKDIIGHCQDLSINETIASLELQEHFMSKMTIPESAVTRNADGTAKLRMNEYFVVGKNSVEPKYVTKDNPFFDFLFTKIKISKNNIAFDTKIPVELLDKEGASGAEKVELAKIRTKPFVTRILSYRTEIEEFVRKIAEFVYRHNNVEPKTFEIKFPDIFEEDVFTVKKDLREELANGVISKKRYLKETRPEMTDAEIDSVLKEIDDETSKEVSFGSGNQLASVGNNL